MKKKIVALSAALILLAAANLRFSCTVTLNGTELGSYSPAAVRRCVGEVTELAGEAFAISDAVPIYDTHCSLALASPEGDEAELKDALLCSVPGVSKLSAVTVKGVRLGYVADGDELRAKLSQRIEAVRPNNALSGAYSGSISIEDLYTCGQAVTNYDDMVLLVSGMAPIMYYTDTDSIVIG